MFGVAVKENHCDEKGMRLESATVPAAVMPDRSNDDGFMITCHCPPAGGWEGFIKPGQVRRPARHTHILSFREKKRRISNRFHS